MPLDVAFDPPGIVIIYIARNPTLLASVSNVKSLLKSGYPSTGAVSSLALRVSKAVSHSAVHQNNAPFLVSACKGCAI